MPGLAATPVVGAFDPGEDREVEPSGVSGPTVEHILPYQRKEPFHRRIVVGGGHAAHGRCEPVDAQGPLIAK